MIALIVVGLGAVVAAVGTGVLAARSSRVPRIYFMAWTAGLFGLAIGLSAATLGYLAGYSVVLFRAMELGAQLIAPLSLCLALVEMVGRKLAGRFAMRLAVSGVAVIALVVLGTDPLSPSVTFSTKWADPSVVYQIAPLAVLGFLALFTVITALATIVLVAVRASRERLVRDETRVAFMVAFAAAALALPGLTWLLAKEAGIASPLGAKDVFAAGCTLAAALVWYAAKSAGGHDLSQVRAGRPDRVRSGDDWDDDGDTDGYGRDRRPSRSRYDTGEFGGYDEPGSEIRYPGLAALAAGPPEPPGDPRSRGGDDLYRDQDSYPQSEPFGQPGHYGEDSGQFTGSGRYDDDSAQFDADPAYGPGADLPRSPQPGYDAPRGRELARRPGWDDTASQREADPRAPLFGQITIYTLADNQAEDFDRLTEWVVAQVRAKEPDTLVYIVHAVPTAPMQRILYEVYRDRAAHEEHLRRGYVMTYETEQRPFVLATNVIELGLQQAKVSPLPSLSAISDILSESGIDLTGITRSPQPMLPPPQDSRNGQYPYDQHDYDVRQDEASYDRPGYPRPGYEQGGQDRPEYERPYQGGWAEMRGEDSRY